MEVRQSFLGLSNEKNACRWEACRHLNHDCIQYVLEFEFGQLFS